MPSQAFLQELLLGNTQTQFVIEKKNLNFT